MFTRSRITSRAYAIVPLLLASLLLTACKDESTSAQSASVNASVYPIPSPDGIWNIIEPPEFPDTYSPPEQYAVATVDVAALQAVLDSAPSEMSRDTSGAVSMSLPLPDETFGTFNIARVYWSNKHTNLVNDLPHESWLAPGAWGTLEVK